LSFVDNKINEQQKALEWRADSTLKFFKMNVIYKDLQKEEFVLEQEDNQVVGF
jgi:hypothetical protein